MGLPDERHGCPRHNVPLKKPLSIGKRVYVTSWKVVNKVVEWHKLPKYLGVFNLLALRYELRDKNLYDTYPNSEFQGNEAYPEPSTKVLGIRNSDGKFNDLQAPLMGCTGMRFGRNVPRKFTAAPSPEEIMTPNPRVISQRILARPPGTFQPATIVNLLAAAWIQFQVHDWVQHVADRKKSPWEIPLPPGDTWPGGKMSVIRTRADEALDAQDVKTPAYRNTDTHWWDASQIYGASEAETQALRSKCQDGKLDVDVEMGETFLPRDANGLPLTGNRQNWWVGLELLHTLFALEHNAIANQLKVSNPTWTSDQLFDTARLVNCALMAKIHTVEWTPAILSHPALDIGMHANWWGLVGEKLWHVFGRVFDNKSEVISGIPGSGVDLDGVPYSLTEEFVSVYRMHPLVPDKVAFFQVADGKHAETLPMKDIAFQSARRPFERVNFADAFYSFGVNYPGAIRAHNYPDFLRDLYIPSEPGVQDARHLDLGAVDILRDRERGIPRYNEFRRLMHMPKMKSFKQITGGDKELAAELEEIYGGDLAKVDLLVGSLCEPLPKGFGFSDTAFRIFILMASRRIKSDRFLAGDGWCPEVYTQEGLNWVQNNGMKDVLCRHFPDLRGPLRNVKNAFAPWEKVGHTAEHISQQTNTPEEIAAANKHKKKMSASSNGTCVH